MKNIKIRFVLLIVLSLGMLSVTALELAKNGGQADNQIDNAAELQKNITQAQNCNNKIFNQPSYQYRIISNMTYSEFYGVGKNPIPEADMCNSDIGTLEEIFPDKYLASCISETFSVDGTTVLSQYFFDQIATLFLNDSSLKTNPDSKCLQHIDNISDLTGLGYFRNIRQIGLNGPSISDISVFLQMPFLMSIDLRGSSVKDVTPILNHDYLETVFLPKNNPELDTTPLSNAGIGFRQEP